MQLAFFLVNYCSSWGLYAQHPNSASIVLADSSVRFVKEGIDRTAIISLYSREEGDVVNSDGF